MKKLAKTLSIFLILLLLVYKLQLQNSGVFEEVFSDLFLVLGFLGITEFLLLYVFQELKNRINTTSIIDSSN